MRKSRNTGSKSDSRSLDARLSPVQQSGDLVFVKECTRDNFHPLDSFYRQVEDIDFRRTEIYRDCGFPIYAFDNLADGQEPPLLFASSGMHCDEYTEIFGHLQFLRARPQIPFISIPLVNPLGLTKFPKRDLSNRRWNSTQRAKLENAWSSTIESFLASYQFAVCIDMHEDTGFDSFYVYNRGPDRFARAITQALRTRGYAVTPQSSVYGDLCHHGVIQSDHIEEFTFEAFLAGHAASTMTSEVPGLLSVVDRIDCAYTALRSIAALLAQDAAPRVQRGESS